MTMRLALLAALAVVVLLAVAIRFQMRRAGQPCPEGQGLYPECLFVATIAGDQITVRAPDQSVSRIAIADLREVVIETKDSGPADADVWWHLSGPDPALRVSYPGGATGESQVLERLQRLPAFDNGAVIDAMGSTSNQRFVVYRR